MFDAPPPMPIACALPSGATAFATLDDLPSAIQTDLKLKAGGLSPAGGAFQATDVGVGPRRRFVAAAYKDGLQVVVYEHGGRGHHLHVVTYQTHIGLPTLVENKTVMGATPCAALTQALISPAPGGAAADQHW